MKRYLVILLLWLIPVHINLIGEVSNTEIHDYILANSYRWEGWCPSDKALAMADLVIATKPNVCVEIGAFGGSSIFPTAYPLKCLNHGVVYAIDPWDTSECLKHVDQNDPNYIWWSQVDLEAIYRGFCRNLKVFGLENFCVVIKDTSINALAKIPDEIDILHIDGNHSEQASFIDAVVYLPRVRPGGYIWFDDIHWHDQNGYNTTRKALEYLLQECEIVQEFPNFVLLQKRELQPRVME